MNGRGAVLLGSAKSDNLLIPERPVEEYVREWAREFEREKQRVERERREIAERYRYKMTGPANNYDQLVNWASQYNTAASITATAITDAGPAPDFTMPAGIPAGTVLRVTAVGQFVVSGSATNLTVQLMYGGTGGTSLFTTGAVALTTSATNVWRIESIIRILTTTTSGTSTLGTAMVDTYQTGISTTANIGLTVAVRSASISIHTETANTIILTTTQSTALTSFNCDTLLIEQLN